MGDGGRMIYWGSDAHSGSESRRAGDDAEQGEGGRPGDRTA